MKSLISSENVTREELEMLFDLADDIKNNREKYNKVLQGYVVATLFFEPSTRTRLSFESAIQRLGAALISSENARENGSSKKGETIEDTIRIVEGYADLIVMRHYENDSASRALKVSSVPIINAGAGGGEHPTQALLDMYTIFEYKGQIDGTSIAMVGDLKYGRTVHSLIRLLGLYNNVTIYGLAVKGLELPPKYIELMKEKNIKYVECTKFEELPSDINFIYQTRVQMERLEDNNIEIKEFIINKDNFSRFSPSTYILHPLPRVEEISTDLDDDPRSIFFEQAHNGLPIRMALIYTIMKDFYNLD